MAVWIKPDGTRARNSAEYLSAWFELVYPMQNLTGLQCQAFDPDILLTNGLGLQVTLPKWFVILLLNNIKDALGWNVRLNYQPPKDKEAPRGSRHQRNQRRVFPLPKGHPPAKTR